MFSQMCRLFKKLKLIDGQRLTAMDKLSQTLKKLKKKAQTYKKKASQEAKKAKGFRRAGDTKAEKSCLSRKILYEQQTEQLEKLQWHINQLTINLEEVKATTETVDALKIGAAEMQVMLKEINFDDVDKTMDEINEQTENMKHIQEALSTPISAAAHFDEDELEAEIEELEGAELEGQLLQPAGTASAAPVHVPTGLHPARPVPQRTAE